MIAIIIFFSGILVRLETWNLLQKRMHQVVFENKKSALYLIYIFYNLILDRISIFSFNNLHALKISTSFLLS